MNIDNIYGADGSEQTEQLIYKRQGEQLVKAYQHSKVRNKTLTR